jgi:hypothetical protein
VQDRINDLSAANVAMVFDESVSPQVAHFARGQFISRRFGLQSGFDDLSWLHLDSAIAADATIDVVLVTQSRPIVERNSRGDRIRCHSGVTGELRRDHLPIMVETQIGGVHTRAMNVPGLQHDRTEPCQPAAADTQRKISDGKTVWGRRQLRDHIVIARCSDHRVMHSSKDLLWPKLLLNGPLPQTIAGKCRQSASLMCAPAQGGAFMVETLDRSMSSFPQAPRCLRAGE